MFRFWDDAMAYLVQKGLPIKILKNDCITDEEAIEISLRVTAQNPTQILEIGTFVGLSSALLLLSAPENTRLVCVDPNLPISYHIGQGFFSDSMRTLYFANSLFDFFNLSSRVVLIEGFSSSYSEKFYQKQLLSGQYWEQKTNVVREKLLTFGKFEVIFIDGDHHTEAVSSDLFLAAQILADNGIIILHDVKYKWGRQVRAGVARFLKLNSDFQYTFVDNLGFLECRKKS